MNRNNKTIHVVRMIAFRLIAVIALGAVTMFLWNWLVPSIFGFGTVTFLQAIGLLILSRVLFGGKGMRPGRRNNEKNRYHKTLFKERFFGKEPDSVE